MRLHVFKIRTTKHSHSGLKYEAGSSGAGPMGRRVQFGTSLNFDVTVGESEDKRAWLIGFFHKASLGAQRDNGHVVFVRKADGGVTNILAIP